MDYTTYSWLHNELSGKAERVKADKGAVLATVKGQVHQTTVALSATRSKIFMWGPLLGIASLSEPAIVRVECWTHKGGCSNEVMEFLRDQPAV